MTRTNAHIESALPIRGRSIPIDDDTVELFHYDISANGVKGTKPFGPYVDDGTILFYDMETIEKSHGTYVIDRSNYGNYGKVYGAISALGRDGDALSFDGVDDYIDIVDLPFDSLSACSLSFWLKLDIVKGWLIAQGQSNSYYIMATSGGTGAFYHSNIGTLPKNIYVDGVLSTTPVADTNWHHYVITGIDISTWTQMIINNYPSWHINGALNKLQIDARILSSEEVLERYNESIYRLDNYGKYGGAIAVEGTEGKLHYTNELINPTEFTASMWVKGPGVAFSLNDPSGAYMFQAGVGSLNWNTGSITGVIQTDDWNMVAVSFSETNGWKLYNNGKLIGEDNNPYTLTVPIGSYISVGCYGEVASNVLIDELRIDKVARTDEEILSWYESGAPFFPIGNERIVL